MMFGKTSYQVNRISLIVATIVSGLALFMSGGCFESKQRHGTTKSDPAEFESALSENDQLIKRMVDAEEQIVKLQPYLDRMGGKTEPGFPFPPTSAETLEYTGLDEFDVETLLANGKREIVRASWPLTSEPIETSDHEIWQKLFRQFELDRVSVGVLAGKYDVNDFVLDLQMEGQLTPKNTEFGCVGGFKAIQRVTLEWNFEREFWALKSWQQITFDMELSPVPLFHDVTDTAIPDRKTNERIKLSKFVMFFVERLTSNDLSASRPQYEQDPDWQSLYQYPAASVVDYDLDGFDDLFLMDRMDAAVLLRNQGDGTFKDVTDSTGLIVDGAANSALFADFDNDGDADVFVCRTVEPCLFFENKLGVFENVPIGEIKFVVSGSVADINRDGLLDVYLCTYRQERVSIFDKQRREQELESENEWLDRRGPQNVVLMNRDGRLERVEIHDELKQFRNSYQSTWADIDDDGDSDLYICNDFSPDVFLRNDTVQGSMQPKFTDVTRDVVPGGAMAFGMGASWGDYNNDGQLDLYVSNMYSKAGNRILKQIPKVDPRIEVSAKGNFLYQRDRKVFRQVAGHETDDQHVDKVGWSFGGQFADFNNDGWLDLHVTSGFFTAPEGVSTEEDL